MGNSLWKKNNSAFSQLAATNPWSFEAVLSASSGTVFASIFDATSGLQVGASEVSTASATPALVTSSFSDSASGFNDLDNMEVQIKETGGNGYIYHAGIWIKLTNLTHAEVYYRYVSGFNWNSGSAAEDVAYGRVLIDPTFFYSPSIYNELV